jgi:hypothetical protein
MLAKNIGFSPIYSLDTVFNIEELNKSNLDLGVYYWQIRNISSPNPVWSPTYSFELIHLDTIPSLNFWLHPESGFQTSGSNQVSSWQNAKSTNNAVQSISASQPALINNAINGYSIVSFDGLNDNLAFARVNDIREAFIVCSHNTGNQAYAPILGDDLFQPDFHGGITNRLFNTSFTSSRIVNGAVLVNGASQSIAAILKPTAFTSYSISSTDSVQASTIAKDRSFAARSWNGDYAEILLFNAPLSSAQKTIVTLNGSIRHSLLLGRISLFAVHPLKLDLNPITLIHL